MILGLGNDIASIERIQKLVTSGEQRFLERCFTTLEIQAYTKIKENNAERAVCYLAKRFTAKEACVKALGTGIRDGMNFYDIETLNDPIGRPIQTVYAKVAERLAAITPKGMTARIHVSLSDERHYAQATVLIEAL